MRLGPAFTGLLFVCCWIGVPGLEAQPNCKKGKPCGNTCIAQNKTCRVGAPSAATPRPAAAPAPAAQSLSGRSAPSSAPWVASIADGVYFRRSCTPAQDLAPANRRYFATEQEAKDAGYRRSRSTGC